MKYINRYKPDYVSLPGETLFEILEERGMTQSELAERMGESKRTISEIIDGKISISSAIALKLERALGIQPTFWNNRQRHYQSTKTY